MRLSSHINDLRPELREVRIRGGKRAAGSHSGELRSRRAQLLTTSPPSSTSKRAKSGRRCSCRRSRAPRSQGAVGARSAQDRPPRRKSPSKASMEARRRRTVLVGQRLQPFGDVSPDRLSVDADPPGEGAKRQALAMQIQDHDEFPKLDHRVVPPASRRSFGDRARAPTIRGHCPGWLAVSKTGEICGRAPKRRLERAHAPMTESSRCFHSVGVSPAMPVKNRVKALTSE